VIAGAFQSFSCQGIAIALCGFILSTAALKCSDARKAGVTIPRHGLKVTWKVVFFVIPAKAGHEVKL